MEKIIQKKTIPHSQADAAWKDMLELFLPQTIALCFQRLPESLAIEIDCLVPAQSLNTKLVSNLINSGFE